MDKEQNNPKIEDEILEVLDSELREDALGFAAYLNANQLTPRLWFGPGYWRVPFGEYYLFGIHMYGLNPHAHKNGWVFWFFSGDYSGEADEDLIKLVRDNVGYCVKCSSDCKAQGVNMTIFDKEYTKICCQFPVRIENSDNETLEKVKKLVDFWKEVAPHSDSWHCH